MKRLLIIGLFISLILISSCNQSTNNVKIVNNKKNLNEAASKDLALTWINRYIIPTSYEPTCDRYTFKSNFDLINQFEQDGIYHFKYKVSGDCTVNRKPWHKDGLEEVCIDGKKILLIHGCDINDSYPLTKDKILEITSEIN